MRTFTARSIFPEDTTMPTFWLEKHFVTIGWACFAIAAMLGRYGGGAEVSWQERWALEARVDGYRSREFGGQQVNASNSLEQVWRASLWFRVVN